MAGITDAGEAKAWELLLKMESDTVSDRAAVFFNEDSTSYMIRSFGIDFTIALRDRSISSDDPRGNELLKHFGDFYRLSALWYLVRSRNIPCTGRHVKLQHISSGDAFSRGSHVLPLERVAEKYGSDKEGFMEKGRSLGGEIVPYGDAAVQLYPVPRVPAVLTLWLEDEEFPARADLLFDSSCELQVPADIIWSMAMMTVLVML